VSLSILDAARDHADRIGLIAGGVAYRFDELAERTRAAAAQPSVVGELDVDTVVAIYAALENDWDTALIHPRLTSAERAALPPPTGAGIIVYTSGSTGAPKAVALTPEMLRASAAGSAAHLGWHDGDRWLCPIPLAHVGGLSVITRCLLARSCAVLGDIDDIESTRATIVSIVPTLLARMIERKAAPQLRAVLVGGAPCTPGLLAQARRRGYPVLATYGMTEACSQIATERTPGGGLEPLINMQVRTDDDHIRVRGPAVAAATATAADAGGWLDTGDLGHLDDRGRLHVIGRADDLIITGGENVHPAEVESALLALPGVREALVFGVPDETWGQIVAAALVAAQPLDNAALRQYVASKLASHKRPRRVCYLDALPRTASGKTDRAAAARRAVPELRNLYV
jgi:O-succinylbenzoic acid--CoA ligase